MGINRTKGSGDNLAEVNASKEQLVKDTDVNTLLTAIKAQTDKLKFTGDYLKTTIA